ncbi:hypothetical protein JH308_00880 [Xanthomonas campestris pv. campestris]|uniref:hypothetical protein n=1 Tax=Xanthomonas campestris TaxID=339 RepID=UPI00226A0440|nr:hypothetical protein [Xanthomonas campestris]MEB1346570.1 hypothetical protein [Xanthomonas campestris pv. campestris]WDK49963.1 hypothetical protein JH308_00880 [Xanthomonas campestris pv. campestris]WDK53784.1 hypothetical protein JH267_20280 [Xanthomonas campestris pv. campestris]WDL62617.1 hypothetical protein JH259_20210 [Xanthomonas campestris pv. campestris]WDL66681.1 hypothetical protein JH269_19550 [Xanthomonas campestris pv. campestris]
MAAAAEALDKGRIRVFKRPSTLGIFIHRNASNGGSSKTTLRNAIGITAPQTESLTKIGLAPESGERFSKHGVSSHDHLTVAELSSAGSTLREQRAAIAYAFSAHACGQWQALRTRKCGVGHSNRSMRIARGAGV